MHNYAGSSSNSECGAECRRAHVCAVGNVDLDDFRMCATQARALSANGAERRAATAAGAISGLAAAALALSMNLPLA